MTDLISNNTSSFQDSLASLLGDSEGTDGHLWDLEDSDVIGDGSNNDSNLVSISSLLHVTSQAGNGERRAVNLAHEQPSEDDLVELGLGPSGQEPVQLDQQPQVDVLALGLSPANLTVLVVADINSHVVFCKKELINKTGNLNINMVYTQFSQIYNKYNMKLILSLSHVRCSVHTIFKLFGLVKSEKHILLLSTDRKLQHRAI